MCASVQDSLQVYTEINCIQIYTRFGLVFYGFTPIDDGDESKRKTEITCDINWWCFSGTRPNASDLREKLVLRCAIVMLFIAIRLHPNSHSELTTTTKADVWECVMRLCDEMMHIWYAQVWVTENEHVMWVGKRQVYRGYTHQQTAQDDYFDSNPNELWIGVRKSKCDTHLKHPIFHHKIFNRRLCFVPSRW